MLFDIFKPRMLEGSIQSCPLSWILKEQTSDEILGSVTHLIPARQVEDERCSQSHLDCLLLGMVVEREGAAQQGVAYAPQAPKITREAIKLLLQNLRCYIAQGAEGLIALLSRS